jgi:uncharacterized protein (TIGR00299 family) protein
MKTAYLDCAAGISGNMFLGAMLDLGLPEEKLLSELGKLAIRLPKITIERVVRNGISAMLFDVPDYHEHHHRHLADIVSILNDSSLSPRIIKSAICCFENLANAEAKVHGVTVDEIHFHEVGAVDAIIDIVGTAIGIDYLGLDQIIASAIRVGYGTVRCAHGEIPLPAPAALELLNGFTIYGGELEGEWTTPTGAAILKTFAHGSQSLPAMKIGRIGYGSGSSERKIPNVLRIAMGTQDSEVSEGDFQIVMETNIDDMNPEFFGYIGDRLMAAGVRDYFFTPIFMKKNRPATKITVITSSETLAVAEKILLDETTTLGLRKYVVQRTCLDREELIVDEEGETIRIKVAKIDANNIKLAPEYDDCVAVAKKSDRPLREIYVNAVHQGMKKMGIEV